MGGSRRTGSDDAVGDIEIELLKLVRYLETFGRRSDLYIEVDRAGYVVLRTLDRLGELSVNTLADELHLDASTVTRQVGRLEGAGLVRRRPDTEDRRSVSVVATPVGRRAMRRVKEERRREIAALVGAWSEAERAGFARAMGRLNLKLVENAAEYRDQARHARSRPRAEGSSEAGEW